MRDLEEVAAELAAVRDRLTALESERLAEGAANRSTARPGGRAAPPAPGELDTELLDQLQRRAGPPFESATERGSVLYAGAVRMGGGSYVWQVERPVPGLLSVDDALIANTLAAVASPTRVRLLKAVLRGAREIHDLQSALGGVSTGQLYHHLKELTAAGLVLQKGRGRYEVAPQSVVPVLAIIAAVYDLSSPATHEQGELT